MNLAGSPQDDSALLLGRLPGENTHTDDGDEAARLWAFFAVAEEEIAAAAGAEIADEDILRAEAGVEELRTVSFAQIEQDVFGRRLVARRPHIEPLEWVGLVAGAQFVEPLGSVRELRLKLDGDFGADFVAAAADGGADGGQQIRGPGAELHVHLADSLGDDAVKRTAPSGMDGGDGALFWINKKNGNTVGGLYAKEQAWAVGDGGVACHGGQAAAKCGWRSFEKLDDVGVNLLECDEL